MIEFRTAYVLRSRGHIMARSPSARLDNPHIEPAQGVLGLLATMADFEDESAGAWQIAAAVSSLISCGMCGVALRSSANESWELALLRDDKRLSASKRNATHADLDFLFEAASDRDILEIPAGTQNQQTDTIPERFQALDIGSMVVIPLGTPRNRVGMLLVGRKDPEGFSGDERLTLQTVAGHFALATQNFRLRGQLDEAQGQLEHLNDVERRYEFLYKNAPAMLHSIDRDGRLVSVSDHWLKVLGYEREEVIGRKSVEFVTEESARRAVEDYLPILMSTGVCLNLEYAFVKKNGETVDVLFSAVMERDADGEFVRSLAVIIDITEQKRAATKVRQLQRELHHVSRLSTMGEMATGLAHELNQPLTAMMNYVRASRRMLEGAAGEPSDKTYEYMDKAIAQADRAGQIIRRLREFVTTGEGDRRLEDVNTIVEEASALALTDTAEMGIAIDYDLADRLPAVLIDKIQIQQVVFNLVRNSFEALADSEQRQVEIKSSRSGDDAVEIAVSDNGPGLPPEISEQLFQPFVTTKAKGMGIGLSICRSIIDAHGGRLWAKSGPDGGAAFHFTVPVAAKDRPDDR